MNLAQIIQRKVYDLAVRLKLSPYRRLWLLQPSDWDKDYASGKLDYYGEFGQQERLQVVIGMVRGFHRKPRVLDIGCGVANLRAMIHGDYLEEYVGLDVSQVAIEAARNRNFPNSRFIVGERPDPSDGLFDVIMLTDMMCYVEDLPGLLESLKPHLAEGGRLITLQYRHPGDIALHRDLARHFTEIHSVTVARNVAPKHAWRISSYGMEGVDPAAIRSALLEGSLHLRAA